MRLAIRVEDLGKQFRIGSRDSAGPRYRSLRESLASLAAAPVRSAKSLLGRSGTVRRKRERIWALQGISLQVNEGEIVGLIGRNGAGKSTLLKILSRITDPTTGFAEIHGRIGSLLEVGTGFHPELTGRENIFLNGAILGMKRREIHAKFDEIVSFAEVEKFLDTPVKFYSSGMHTRLAFSVAAHLEPEILLVDEVLAVGDAGFQQKCLNKMGGVAASGRTVLFVSHQLNQVRRLCTRAVWLDQGQVRLDGPPSGVVSEYEAGFRVRPHVDQEGKDKEAVSFVGWELVSPEGREIHSLSHFDRFIVRFWLKVPHRVDDWQHGIALMNQDGQVLWGTATSGSQIAEGLLALDYSFPSLPLKPGYYEWLLSIFEGGKLLHMWNAMPSLHVATPPVTHPIDAWAGMLNIPYALTIRSGDELRTSPECSQSEVTLTKLP